MMMMMMMMMVMTRHAEKTVIRASNSGPTSPTYEAHWDDPKPTGGRRQPRRPAPAPVPPAS
eukprot:9288332-Karenia_brevis.AAC.1